MLGLNQYINPIHFEIIEPLKKWKILSLKDLKEETKTGKSDASIYKIIKRLEGHQVIDSFIDSWSKEKHIYLDQNAREYFDIDKHDLIPRDRRYHDAITVKLLRTMLKEGYIKKAMLDDEIKKKLTAHDHIPDGTITIRKDEKDYLIAIEMELNQKNKVRIQDYFNYYRRSNIFSNALYIFNRHSIYNTYKDQLDLIEDNKNKILLMYLKDLRLDNINLADAIIYHDGKEKCFSDLFQRGLPISGERYSSACPERFNSFNSSYLTS